MRDQNTDFQKVDAGDKFATPVDAGKEAHDEAVLQAKTPEAPRVTKALVSREVRRQSAQFVGRLSVFQKHRLLTHPNSFYGSVAESVKKDGSSILSSTRDLNSGSKHGSLVDNP